MKTYIIYNEMPYVPTRVVVEELESYRQDPDEMAVYYKTKDRDYEQVISSERCAIVKANEVETEDNGTVLVIRQGPLIERYAVSSFIRPCLQFSEIESVAFNLEMKYNEQRALQELAKRKPIEVGFTFLKKDHIVIHDENGTHLMCNKNRQTEFGVVVPEQLDNLCTKCLSVAKSHLDKNRFKVIPYEPEWWKLVIGR